MAKLVNGVEMNKAHPETFFIPSDADKSAVNPGDMIKIAAIANPAGGSERFWLKVTENNKSARNVSGIVANHLLFTDYHGLRFGSEVWVDYDQILIID